MRRDPAQFASARHGYQLERDDQMRRFALMSLLHVSGLDATLFLKRFDQLPEEALPQLNALAECEYVIRDEAVWRLTEAGLERSDQIGPFFFSSRVRERMEDYACV
jgi:oxygen-independent coproporphyrinogen-3 oxidase